MIQCRVKSVLIVVLEVARVIVLEIAIGIVRTLVKIIAVVTVPKNNSSMRRLMPLV